MDDPSPPAPPEARPPWWRPTLERVAAGTAVVVSLASLFIAWRQSDVMERQLAASVWPSLTYEHGNAGPAGEDLVVLTIKNGGIGPARLRAFEVAWKGAAVTDSAALIRAACGDRLGGYTISTAPVRGVLPAGGELNFLQVNPARSGRPLYDCLNRARFELDGQVCYCSAVEECWSAAFRDPEPRPVADCRAAAARPQYRE